MNPFSTLRKVRHGLGFVAAFLTNVKKPDADAVLRMERHGTALSTPEMTAKYIEGLLADEPTRELLRDRWTPPRLTREQLLAMPQGTLGHELGVHLKTFDLDLEFHPHIDTAREDEFVRCRLYQIHDFIHVLTDYDATDAGEMGIVGFYLAQYLQHHDQGGLMAGSFMGLLAASVILHASTVDDSQLRPFIENLVEGYQRGKAADCLIGPRWELEIERSVEELRAEYGITPRPGRETELRASA